MNLYSTARVANFNGDLADLVSRYSKDFTKVPAGFPAGRLEIEKYFLIEGEGNKKTIIMISQNLLGFALKDNLYNLMLTVFSADEEQVKKTLQNIESKLSVNFREAPILVKELGDFLTGLVK